MWGFCPSFFFFLFRHSCWFSAFNIVHTIWYAPTFQSRTEHTYSCKFSKLVSDLFGVCIWCFDRRRRRRWSFAMCLSPEFFHFIVNRLNIIASLSAFIRCESNHRNSLKRSFVYVCFFSLSSAVAVAFFSSFIRFGICNQIDLIIIPGRLWALKWYKEVTTKNTCNARALANRLCKLDAHNAHNHNSKSEKDTSTHTAFKWVKKN